MPHKLIFLVFAIITLIGCNEKQKTQENAPIEKSVEIPKKKTSVAKSSKTNFGGNWINKKYADRLLSTKSPRKSQDVAPVTMLVLPDNFGENATIVFGFHEGITGKVDKKDDSFEIHSPHNDSPANSFQLKNGRIKTKDGEFIKLESFSGNNDYKVVEQLLFTGKYDMDGKEVEFTSDGKVSGLGPFKFYSVLIDYYDAGMQVDQIRLGQNAKNGKLYGFTFKKDNLSIYELKCTKRSGNHCEVVKNDQRLYQLKKIS